MKFTGERFIPEELKQTDETYQEHIERYRFASPYLKNLVVLDAACGTGYGSQMIASFANKVYAIDVSHESVQYAKEKYPRSNIIYEQMDVVKLRYPACFFDAVVSFETIEHINNPGTFVHEIHRVLKPGGLLIISTPNKETTCDGLDVHAPFHIKEYTLDEFLLLLASFEQKKIFVQKMAYYKRTYKKLRLLSRYVGSNLRNVIAGWIEKYFLLSTGPWFLRILLYEFKYKFTVIEFLEKDIYIKPTIFVVVCSKPK